MIIGLVAKNAILIVEFAKVECENGATIAEAALAGARLRFRPILMTSLAFMAGCLPLAVATGSGALARQVLGTAVIGGMLAASGIAIFLIPSGFCIVERFMVGAGETCRRAAETCRRVGVWACRRPARKDSSSAKQK
jgi:HAE1 family hydrophobic/amphiphilic exporter-1